MLMRSRGSWRNGLLMRAHDVGSRQREVEQQNADDGVRETVHIAQEDNAIGKVCSRIKHALYFIYRASPSSARSLPVARTHGPADRLTSSSLLRLRARLSPRDVTGESGASRPSDSTLRRPGGIGDRTDEVVCRRARCVWARTRPGSPNLGRDYSLRENGAAMSRHCFAGLAVVLTFVVASRSDAQVAIAGVAAVDTIHHQHHMSHHCKQSGAVNDTTARTGTHHAVAHHGRGSAHDSAKHATKPDHDAAAHADERTTRSSTGEFATARAFF